MAVAGQELIDSELWDYAQRRDEAIRTVDADQRRRNRGFSVDRDMTTTEEGLSDAADARNATLLQVAELQEKLENGSAATRTPMLIDLLNMQVALIESGEDVTQGTMTSRTTQLGQLAVQAGEQVLAIEENQARELDQSAYVSLNRVLAHSRSGSDTPVPGTPGPDGGTIPFDIWTEIVPDGMRAGPDVLYSRWSRAIPVADE